MSIALGGGSWHKLLDWYLWYVAFPLPWSVAAGTAVDPYFSEARRDSVGLAAQLLSERG